MPRVLDPGTELRALLSACRMSTAELSARTGVSKRQIDALLEFRGDLSIDDLTRCKAVLTDILVRRMRGQPDPATAAPSTTTGAGDDHAQA